MTARRADYEAKFADMAVDHDVALDPSSARGSSEP